MIVWGLAFIESAYGTTFERGLWFQPIDDGLHSAGRQ